ncbi:MAG: hypothetical protein ACHQ9S_04050 [Candidatus Binatia bacterium]
MIRVPSSERIPVGYRFGPAVIDVEADDPDAARWLAEFLTPWFEADAPGTGEFIVRLTCSAPAFAALDRQRAAVASHPVACFALDSQVVSLPGWAEEDGGTVIADSGRSCFYRVRRRSVEIVARPGIRRVRVGLMRVVRELAAARMLAQASVLDFHAAAFAVGERAVLLVGAKGAGKTTLLVHVLASGRASLLANDRVFVDASRHPEHAFGVPTLVSLRDDTLRLFPSLRHGFPERPALLHAAELESHDVGAFDGDDAPRDFALSPAQLACRLGVSTVRCAPIAAIVFPDISPAADAWSIEPVAPTDGAGRLRECLYGARSGPRSRTVFEEVGGGRVLCREAQTALLDRLAAGPPLFHCRLGRDAYREGADAWLRALPLEPASETCVA